MTKIINWSNSCSDSNDDYSESKDFLYDYSIEYDDNDFFNTSEEEEYEFISTDSLILDLDYEIQKYLEKKAEEKKLVVENYANINIRETSEIPLLSVTLPEKKIIPYKPNKIISFDDVISEMKNRKPQMDFMYQIIWMDQINKEIRGFKKEKLKFVFSPLKEKEYPLSWYETITSYFWN